MLYIYLYNVKNKEKINEKICVAMVNDKVTCVIARHYSRVTKSETNVKFTKGIEAFTVYCYKINFNQKHFLKLLFDE